MNPARRALDFLGTLLQKGGSVERSDVEGVIRMAVALDDQLILLTFDSKIRLSMAQILTRKKSIAARKPSQGAYMRALECSELVFVVGPAGTGKAISW